MIKNEDLIDWINVIQNFCVYTHNFIFAPNLLKQETCRAFDGIPYGKFSIRPVCCNKNCPKCGGLNCDKFTDASGKILGRSECCAMPIMRKGNLCGSDKAPCKFQFTGNNFLDYYGELFIY